MKGSATPRIVLLGAQGQVGWELARSLQALGELVAWNRGEADLSEPLALVEPLVALAPDVVISAAAYTAVDRAEQEPELAMIVNGVAPGVMADAARRAGALFVHYSTDYVFDGSGIAPRSEHEAASPINAYGRSKLAGEQAVAAAGGDWLILRTSWVYAARGNNFVRTMLRLGSERETLRVVDDQVGAPTSARFLADATALIVRQALAERRCGGFASELLHLSASGEASWHAFATAIFEGWRALERGAGLKVRELVPIRSSEYPTPAARPLNSRLDCSRVSSRFDLHRPHWKAGLDLVLAELAGSCSA